MAERVLLARHDPAGGYELSRRHWAETDRLIAAAVRGRYPKRSDSENDQRSGRASWSTLVDRLDYLRLALCLRCDPDSVRLYLPVWLGIPTGDSDETDSNCGALVRVDSHADFTRLRARLRRRKERLGRAIETNRLGFSEAQQSLLALADCRERYLSAAARECLSR